VTADACAVCRRGFTRRRRSGLVNGELYCAECALLVAIALAMARVVAVVLAVALCATAADADLPNATLTPAPSRIRTPPSYAPMVMLERTDTFRTPSATASTTSTAWREAIAKAIVSTIPLEIGGANDPRNLWPQRFADAKRKDRVEDALHEAVCVEHTLTLEQAQAAIARDWTRTPVPRR
jgi:hypothetical protein